MRATGWVINSMDACVCWEVEGGSMSFDTGESLSEVLVLSSDGGRENNNNRLCFASAA